jgi:hypothetical protein
MVRLLRLFLCNIYLKTSGNLRRETLIALLRTPPHMLCITLAWPRPEVGFVVGAAYLDWLVKAFQY